MSDRSDWLGRSDGLTARESQVIAMCADGLSNQEIADALFVNIETVKSHLKRAYGRLGLRNRAEVATYVHHHREAGRFAPRVGRAMTPEPIAPQLGLSDAVLAERRHLMGLSSTSRASLTDRADDVAAGSAAYADRLIARWLTAPTTAPYLEQDAVAKRLAEHQARYLESLFGSDLGGEHVEMVLRIGATHHRLKLPPQWHLASYAHLIGEHLGLLFDRAGSVHGFLETVDVLVRSVLFDTSLMLDAYEMHLVQEILDDEANRPTASDSYETDEGIDAEHIGTPVVAASMSRLAADLTQVGVRRDFIGLDADRLSILRRIAPEIEQAIPAMLDDFYSLVAETPSTAELVDDSSIDRLINQVDIYWRDLLHSRFDRGHAASRMRVGMVHERIGLAPQFYVAGLGRQLGGILHALERDPSPVDAVDALLRAVFFDLTFVIDAYVEARANALTQTDRFASQLIAGLSTGMAIVDVRNRIEVVNQQLLDLVGIPAAIAHRMPVADALPFAGIDELVDAVRQSGGQRRSIVVAFRDTTLRLTMVGLELSATGRVGMVVDDIAAIVRLGEERAREQQRFLEVLSAVGAVAWEIDRDTLLVVAVSAGSAPLLGGTEEELLGRLVFTDLIDGPDRRAFEETCLKLGDGGASQLDHGLRPVHGPTRRARTTLAASNDRFGNPTISGVSILVADD